MDRSAGDPIESLRDALRRRGYLDRGLDRMMLRDAGSRAGWLVGCLRAGLLSGAFLGLALLLVLVLSRQPLLTSRETALLGVYLAALSIFLMTVFEIGCALLARLLVGVAPRSRWDAGKIARTVGVTGTLAAALYLSLWWHGRGGGGPAAQFAVIAVILALSLAFGRLTSLAALLSLIRPGRLPAPRAGGVRARLVVSIGLLLLVGTLILAPWGRNRSTSSSAARIPPAALHPAPGRILWVAIDGLGDELFRTLKSAGHLPYIASLQAQGCLVGLSRPAAEPPSIWVSAATGFPPERHGIRGVDTATLAGIDAPVGDSAWAGPLLRAAKWMAPWLPPVRQIPVSGVSRQDKMIWEIMSDLGRPSYVVNWWATWPAGEGLGVLITERAYFRLDAGGPPDREISPREEFERLRAQFPEFLRLHPRGSLGRPGRDPGVAGAELDTYHLDRAADAWKDGHWPLVAVYLNGGDLIASGFKGAEHPAGGVQRAASLIAHLDYVDSRVEEMAAARRPGDVLLIQGDPGRESDPAGDSGFLLMIGRGIGHQTVRGRLLDVTPTLLRIAGLPLSREMAGRPAEACLDGAVFGDPNGLPSIAGYGERRPADSRASDFDPEVLERLRSLGYIR
ncbi:MAG TPA: hypothetical protein VGR67_12970 [Candidatus Polarisedimenticolia bacterium]|jgi:hypothetical protein|nr:hypothetical protein [Candidatus Polarisedimenticolia bacterium]